MISGIIPGYEIDESRIDEGEIDGCRMDKGRALRIIVIRHGQTDWNREGRYLGHTDMPLNEEGRRQAQEAADHLKAEHFAAIYASDLRRTMETAWIIARPHGLTVNPVPGLREMNFGAWDGLTYEEIIGGYGDMARRWFDDPTAVTPPGGESVVQVWSRVVNALDTVYESEIRSRASGTVAIVTHGGPIRVVRCLLEHRSPADLWKVRHAAHGTIAGTFLIEPSLRLSELPSCLAQARV